MLAEQTENLALWINSLAAKDTIWAQEAMVYALFAVVLIWLVCGGVGSLVVGLLQTLPLTVDASLASALTAAGLLAGAAARAPLGPADRRSGEKAN